ncbi:MAG: cytochrome C oxidase subunit IV family protein [Candidatus Omnitrophica bacterium]|nr:cytochrome C oxidase subunit IV family protein [Candidatus Omnitrophota bacterium]
MATRALQPRYLLIGIWLAGLMLLGVVFSEVSGGFLPLPRWGVVTLILALSTIKATLVALYYMHLQSDRKLLVLVALAPVLLIVLACGVIFSSRLVRL